MKDNYMKLLNIVEKYQRPLLRNHLDNICIFIGRCDKSWKKYLSTTYPRKIINKLYGFDNDIEFFIRNGHPYEPIYRDGGE